MFSGLKVQIYALLGLVLLIFIFSLMESTVNSGRQWQFTITFGPKPVDENDKGLERTRR